MTPNGWTKAKDLISWSDSLEARQKLPALVRRLIHATIANPRLCQFPADEGIQRPGWDGVAEIDAGNAWVPEGRSVWEMGTSLNPQEKANADYAARTTANRSESSFVFVTPRKWDGKRAWAESKQSEKKWRNVLAWDCDDLEQWLEQAPAVDAWMSRLLGKVPGGVRDLISCWESLAATSDPPMTPAVFAAGREQTIANLTTALKRAPAEIVVSALSLELLAWDTTHLSRVALVLSTLARIHQQKRETIFEGRNEAHPNEQKIHWRDGMERRSPCPRYHPYGPD